MFESIPVHYQVAGWPLLGAAIILALHRYLPAWVRRVVALAAAVATLVSIWSLTAGDGTRAEALWDPVNFYRMSPSLFAGSPATGSPVRFFGTILTGFSVAAVLGIRGSHGRRSVWHGMLLLALSGCLVLVMGANLLTVAMGSALLDMALLAVVVSAASRPDGAGRVAWRMAVPGVLSTLVLVVSTLQMDVETGSASLTFSRIPSEVLVLICVAGLLRMVVFPLHPRGLCTPETGALFILSVGTGVYLLYRVQTHAPNAANQPWILAVGCLALLAGGLMAWAGHGERRDKRAGALEGNARPAETAEELSPTSEGQHGTAIAAIWPGLAIHQTGMALTYAALQGTSTPWPLVSLVLALGLAAIWWDSQSPFPSRRDRPVLALGLLQPVRRRLETRLSEARASLATRFRAVLHWRGIRVAQYWAALAPCIAVASLVGVPATAGGVGRWRLYTTLLRSGRAVLLIGILIADLFLCAGLWRLARYVLSEARTRRPGVIPTLVMMALGVFLVAAGTAPAAVVDGLGPNVAGTARSSGVSGLGVALLYSLPWLLGGWLAYTIEPSRPQYLRFLPRIVNLDWAFRLSAWLADRLAGAVHWLGQVGEGEGWWGWAVIVLALGTMLLANL